MLFETLFTKCHHPLGMKSNSPHFYSHKLASSFKRKELRACNKKNNRIASYRIIIYLLEVPYIV